MKHLIEKVLKLSEDIFTPASKEEIGQRKLNQHASRIEGIKKEILSRSKQTSDGLVVEGDIDVAYIPLQSIKALGLQIAVVNGSVSFRSCDLQDVQGSPKIVNGTFNVEQNKISSLIGGPKEVRGRYNCENNLLTSLEGSPEYVESFSCRNNKLTNLKGAPKVCKVVFDCRSNLLTSLEGIPTRMGSFVASGNRGLVDISALSTTTVKGEVTLPDVKAIDLKKIDYRKLRIGGGIKVYDSVQKKVVERLESDVLRFLKPFFSKSGSGSRMKRLQFDKITDDDLIVNENPASILKDVKSGKYDNYYIYWILMTLNGKDTKAYARTEFRYIKLPYLLASSKGKEFWQSSNDFKMYNHLKTVADFADLAVLIPADKFEVDDIRKQRQERQTGAISLSSDQEIRTNNQRRYQELLANKRANVDFKVVAKEYIDVATQLAFDVRTGKETMADYTIVGTRYDGKSYSQKVGNAKETVMKMLSWIWGRIDSYNHYTQSSSDDYHMKQASNIKNEVVSALAGLKDKKVYDDSRY